MLTHRTRKHRPGICAPPPGSAGGAPTHILVAGHTAPAHAHAPACPAAGGLRRTLLPHLPLPHGPRRRAARQRDHGREQAVLLLSPASSVSRSLLLVCTSRGCEIVMDPETRERKGRRNAEIKNGKNGQCKNTMQI